MQFITVREFRSSTAKMWRKLRKERQLIVTRRGKPVAVVSSTDERQLGETLRDLERQKFKELLGNIQRESVKNGTADMRMEEIDAEIAQVRRERRAKRGNGE